MTTSKVVTHFCVLNLAKDMKFPSYRPATFYFFVVFFFLAAQACPFSLKVSLSARV